jgi:hypothetical protein
MILLYPTMWGNNIPIKKYKPETNRFRGRKKKKGKKKNLI